MKHNETKNVSCHCNSTKGLFIPNRRLSFIVAGCTGSMLFVFMIGYFYGQRMAINEFIDQTTHHSFADQIFASLCSLCDQEPEITQKMNNDTAVEEMVVEKSLEKDDASNIIQVVNREAIIEPQKEQIAFYAPLIGFNAAKKKDAIAYAQRLQKRGYPVTMRERKSKTAKGVIHFWYQIVTEPMLDKEKLSLLIDRIVKEEKLKGVRILAYKKIE